MTSEYRGDVLLLQIWSQFKNSGRKQGWSFLFSHSEAYRGCLDKDCELNISDGFRDLQAAQSTLKGKIPNLTCSHVEAETWLIFHSLEGIERNHNRILVICKHTKVIVFLLCCLERNENDTCMVSGTCRQRKCYSVSQETQNLHTDVTKTNWFSCTDRMWFNIIFRKFWKKRQGSYIRKIHTSWKALGRTLVLMA